MVFENSNGEVAVTNITTRFVTTAQEVCYQRIRRVLKFVILKFEEFEDQYSTEYINL